MKAKRIIAHGLMYFVVASLAFLAGKSFRPAGGGSGEPERAAGARDGVFVTYYFYGKKRCDACRALEAHTKRTVAEEFADRGVAYEFVDCDRPENAHYMEELDLESKAVVVSDFREGNRISHTVLDMGKAFSLVVEEPLLYRHYLGGCIEEMLEEPGDG